MPCLYPSLISQFSSVQLLSHVGLFATPWTAAHQPSLSFTISWSLLWFMSIELVMLYNYLILCCLHLLLPSVFPSIRIFFNVSALHIRWPKYWSFSISPSNEWIFRIISLRIDLFHFLAVQGTPKGASGQGALPKTRQTFPGSGWVLPGGVCCDTCSEPPAAEALPP